MEGQARKVDSKVLARQPLPARLLDFLVKASSTENRWWKFRALPTSLFETQHSSHFAENRKIVDPRIDWIEVLSIRRVSSKWKSWVECGEWLTNLQNAGWISADRGTKATLMRTIPRSLFKSSTKDLSLPIFELVFSKRLLLTFVPELDSAVAIVWSWAYTRCASLYVLMITSGKAKTYRRFPAWILA